MICFRVWYVITTDTYAIGIYWLVIKLYGLNLPIFLVVMTTVVEDEMGCLKYVILKLCMFMLQKFDDNTWFAHEPAVYKVFLFFFGCNFVIKQQQWWSSTREISQNWTIQVKRKVENFKECYYVLATFRRKTFLETWWLCMALVVHKNPLYESHWMSFCGRVKS